MAASWLRVLRWPLAPPFLRLNCDDRPQAAAASASAYCLYSGYRRDNHAATAGSRPDVTAGFPWRYLLILGIVHTGIMYQLLYSAIQKLPTPITGSLSFIYPLVAIVVDYLVFHHALTPVQLVGGLLILFAAAGNNLGWGDGLASGHKTPPKRV